MAETRSGDNVHGSQASPVACSDDQSSAKCSRPMPHREEQWQADGRGAASAFSSCLKPLAAADNTCGPPFALLYFITLACMRPFHNGDSPTHCLSLPSPPAPSPPFLSLSLRSTTPSQELKSSAAGRLRRHAMPAARAASTASCSHLVAVPPPVAPPSSLALCAHSPIHLAPTTVLSLALWTRTGRRGGGLPLREAAGGAAAALISPSPSVKCAGNPLRWRGGVWGLHRRFPTLLPSGHAGTRGGGREAAVLQVHHEGEYRDGLGLSSTPSQELRCWSSETPCHACCPRCFNCLLLSRHQLSTRSSMPSPLPATPFPLFHLLLHRPLENTPLVGHRSHATDLPASGDSLRCRWRGGVWGLHRRSLTPLPCGRAGTRTGRRGGGLPLREAAGGAAAALISSSHVSVQVTLSGAGSLGVCGVWHFLNPWPSLPFQFWHFSVEGRGVGVYTDASPRSSPVAMQGLMGTGGRQRCSMAIPLQQGRVLGWAWPLKRRLAGPVQEGRGGAIIQEGKGREAALQQTQHTGEYRDGLGLSRSLAMQQRQLTGPVAAASAAGSTGAAGEGRGGEGGGHEAAALGGSSVAS
ncbi:unnamed protein product [Closterium sp. NIES-65]|nr:unnamed protein product [Closterium sp. NIES-65]